MKISKLHIEKFRHLENLEFDFTYPEDFHDEAKRGKPLDKICFIGQSATGKTGLLELICEEVNSFYKLRIINNNEVFPVGDFKKTRIKVEFKLDSNSYTKNKDKIQVNNNIYSVYNGNYNGGGKDLIPRNGKNDIIYIKSDIVSSKNIEILTKNPIELLENKYYRELNALLLNYIIDNEIKTIKIFNDSIEPEMWAYLLAEILKYREKFTQKMSEIIHKGLLSNQNELMSEFVKWQTENPNALELFAQKFNPILEKLNLEVDIVNTKFIIPIKNKKTNEVIPFQNTSTGTKGLLLSFLPLYKLDTKDAIILIDEPERSLYPDMQIDLMEYYQNLAPEAQFIIATHSPFVAASFEPEERFILYFDEEGKVAVRRGSSPIGDDPNDILCNDFGIDYINKYGKKVYKEYLEKRRQLLFEKDEKARNILQNEIESIGDKYNF